MLSLAQASMESQGGMERCIASICLPIQTGGGARRNRYKFGFAYWIQIWICILLDGDKGPRLVRHITNIGMGEGGCDKPWRGPHMVGPLLISRATAPRLSEAPALTAGLMKADHQKKARRFCVHSFQPCAVCSVRTDDFYERGQ